MSEGTAGADAEAETPTDASDERSYGGLFGAFPYAFRASDSRLFRSYVVVGGLLSVVVTLLFGLALIALIGRTVGTPDGTFSFVRSFYVLVGLLAVAPLLAPVLLVARRHRRGWTVDRRYDAALAAAGYLAAVSLYLAAVISAPETLRDPPSGALAPLVAALYALPPLAGIVPPLTATALLAALHYGLREDTG